VNEGGRINTRCVASTRPHLHAREHSIQPHFVLVLDKDRAIIGGRRLVVQLPVGGGRGDDAVRRCISRTARGRVRFVAHLAKEQPGRLRLNPINPRPPLDLERRRHPSRVVNANNKPNDSLMLRRILVPERLEPVRVQVLRRRQGVARFVRVTRRGTKDKLGLARNDQGSKAPHRNSIDLARQLLGVLRLQHRELEGGVPIHRHRDMPTPLVMLPQAERLGHLRAAPVPVLGRIEVVRVECVRGVAGLAL